MHSIVPLTDLEVTCRNLVVTAPFVFLQLQHDYGGILGRPWLEACNLTSTGHLDHCRGHLAVKGLPQIRDCARDSSTKVDEFIYRVPSKRRLAPVEVSLQLFRERLEIHKYLEIFRLVLETGVLPKPTPREVVNLLNEFDDVFDRRYGSWTPLSLRKRREGSTLGETGAEAGNHLRGRMKIRK